VYGRGRGQAQLIPGWPYSVIAALEPGRTSWTAVLDAVRLGPDDDETAVTAADITTMGDSRHAYTAARMLNYHTRRHRPWSGSS
jgi:hypothetical protein